MSKMGRPKSDNPANKAINIRMTEERYNRLKAYCDLYNQTITETVLHSVDVFLDQEEKKRK